MTNKRIKKVFSNADQVIHLWANQSQSDARCRNAFFNGKSIYSYGHHYELGRFIKYNGHEVVLINDAGYSKTTQGHINSAWYAVSHKLRLRIVCSDRSLDDTTNLVQQALIRWQDEIIENLFNPLNRLKFYNLEYTDGYTDSNLNEFNNTAIKLGFKNLVLNVPDDHYELLNSHVQARFNRQTELTSPEAQAKREALRIKRDAVKLAKMQGAIQEWTQGGPVPKGLRDVSPMLIRVIGDEVQTSRGARVSLAVAQKILSRVAQGIVQPGEAVGPFQFNKVNGDTVQIGCHTFSLEACSKILMAPNVEGTKGE